MSQQLRRTWYHKFADAGRGVRFAVAGSSSFYVHIAAAIGVMLAGWWFSVTTAEWCLIALCISLVMSMEAVNSSIEVLAKLIDREHNPQLGKALDMASGAVLIVSISSGVVGMCVFIPRLWTLVQP